MKRLKNASLSILSGLLLITLVTISCSKDKDEDEGGPSISSITPSSGLTGATITIAGNNLSGSSVVIGGISAYVSDNTATSITTTIPHLSTGSHEVAVTNSLGTAKSNITVTGVGAPPVITSITPEDVAKGQSITITGTGLGGAVVEIATKVSDITANTNTSITVVVPTNIALGSAAVRVTTMLGTVTSSVNIID